VYARSFLWDGGVGLERNRVRQAARAQIRLDFTACLKIETASTSTGGRRELTN
jgi:hypothetical protein